MLYCIWVFDIFIYKYCAIEDPTTVSLKSLFPPPPSYTVQLSLFIIYIYVASDRVRGGATLQKNAAETKRR